MRSKAYLPLAGLLVTALVAGCGGDEPSEPASTAGGGGTAEACTPDAGHELSHTHSVAGSMLYLPFYVAMEGGHFEDNGVTVEHFDAGAGMVPSLINGDADVIDTAMTGVADMVNEGREISVVGTYANQHLSGLVVSKEFAEEHDLTAESDFEDKIQALKGTALATTRVGGGAAVLLDEMLRDGGLDPATDVEISNFDQAATILGAFVSGRVDGFVSGPPYSNQAVAENDAVYLINPAEGHYPQLDAFVLSAPTVLTESLQDETFREGIGCYLRGLDAALAQIKEDPEGSLEMADTWFGGLDPELRSAAYEDSKNIFPDTVAVDAEGIQATMDFLGRSSEVPEDIDAFVDTTVGEDYLG